MFLCQVMQHKGGLRYVIEVLECLSCTKSILPPRTLVTCYHNVLVGKYYRVNLTQVPLRNGDSVITMEVVEEV